MSELFQKKKKKKKLNFPKKCRWIAHRKLDVFQWFFLFVNTKKKRMCVPCKIKMMNPSDLVGQVDRIGHCQGDGDLEKNRATTDDNVLR